MEETPVRDATIEVPAKKNSQKKVEIVLLLVLGILIGFSVKTETSKRFVVGHDDYLLGEKDATAYDLNTIQKNLVAKSANNPSSAVQPIGGAACGQ